MMAQASNTKILQNKKRFGCPTTCCSYNIFKDFTQLAYAMNRVSLAFIAQFYNKQAVRNLYNCAVLQKLRRETQFTC